MRLVFVALLSFCCCDDDEQTGKDDNYGAHVDAGALPDATTD